MKKKILLTDEQYKELVKVVFYGEWLLNANKVGMESMDKESMEIRDYIYNHRDTFSLSEWMIETNDGPEIKTKIVLDLLDNVFEYNEHVFWMLLIEKLADRDALEEIDQSDEVLSDSQKEDIVFEHQDKYTDVFANKGLKPLRLVDDE
ncbi:MAG: hypothetical protein GVX78_04945 [Bacteroidetes bacterium]|jgi:hypothetical protein|nr:hypothetical protein [Bacteroidota bacterium]